jgi:hypothetical protein
MVKESWSNDKAKREENRKKEIRNQRIKLFHELKKTPAFTTVSILSVFDPITKEATDLATMANGDTYKGKRKDLERMVSTALMQKVDNILGLRVIVFFNFNFTPNQTGKVLNVIKV